MWNNMGTDKWMHKSVKVFHCLLSNVFYIRILYRIVLDSAVDTLGNGKDVVDCFNTVQKRYLATCLRMLITSEVDKIESKHMRVDAMTKKGEVSPAKECKRLLDISDEVGNKGDKNNVKKSSSTLRA